MSSRTPTARARTSTFSSAWAEGARTALDVATGGGHVARRLRELGIKVVTVDPAPGMQPDVISRAEELPFADASFDVVACRTAAHHFADVGAAVREMARVSADRVLIVDTLFMGEDEEEAERLRDPSHVRNYSDAEWRGLVTDAGLGLDDVRFIEARDRLRRLAGANRLRGRDGRARPRALGRARRRRPADPRQDRDQGR